MSRKIRISVKDVLSTILLVACVAVFALSYSVAASPDDVVHEADRARRRVEQRMDILDGYMTKAMGTPYGQWMEMKDLPQDMVVYLYEGGMLSSWIHSFPTLSDDIRPRVSYQALSEPGYVLDSPLSLAGEIPSFVNIGPKWYLLKAISGGGRCVIGGLEISNEKGFRSQYSINSALKVASSFTILPLSSDEGAAVEVDGNPVFKIVNMGAAKATSFSPEMLWAALFLLLVALLTFLWAHRTLLGLGITAAGSILALYGFYFLGKTSSLDNTLFSPVLFSDGGVLYSLGALILISVAILFLTLALFIVRGRLNAFARRRAGAWTELILLCSFALASALFFNYSFRTVAREAVFSMNLFRIQDVTALTLLTYASLVSVAVCVPVLLNMMRTSLHRLCGWSPDVSSPVFRMVYSLLLGVYVIYSVWDISVDEENMMADQFAEKISVSCDVQLEENLKVMEESLAADPLVSTLVAYDNMDSMLYNRLSSYYFLRIASEYDMSVYLYGGSRGSEGRMSLLNVRLKDSERISDRSHFFCARSRSGRAWYTGIFNYFDPAGGLRQMVICLDPKNSIQDRGYMSILDLGPSTDKTVVPARYSYVRYIDGALVLYRGEYPYPTHISVQDKDGLQGRRESNGWVHFCRDVSEDNSDIVIVSRQKEPFINYAVAALLIALVAYFFISAFLAKRVRRRFRSRRFFRQRMILVISVSLLLTLVIMAMISVYYVYRSNGNNLQIMMSEKINSVQSMVEGRFRSLPDTKAIYGVDIDADLKEISNVSQTDVLLYSPQGTIMGTSNQELFDRALVGMRMDEDAYREIVTRRSRVYIEMNRLGIGSYYSLYAPVFNQDGRMIAIAGSIDTDDYYDCEAEAMSHLATIMAVFLLLLIMTRFIVIHVIGRIFRPLTEIGRKMDAFSTGDLEPIRYDRNDEIANLVAAYNSMVEQIEASRSALAQAERDRVWSSMARQIAHEIKNPLTPMKLQIQRIMRLKAKDAPNWQDTFDEVSNVVLYHIDVLSGIANEFLLFAKVDTEEKVEVDLDRLVRDEVMMYEHRDDISITFMGFPEAVVIAPKPQISRVIINLLNNATQAIEGAMREGLCGGEGQILVSLRQSLDGKAYEILVEDNGPGVDEDSVQKLFSSSFTTKDGGTGIGLTMCHSMLQKCGASISYSRSVALGGASFKIYYPKA